jgi:SAM-dependent methyltransferase/uncharacterized protein YbaR (Trm112 family)
MRVDVLERVDLNCTSCRTYDSGVIQHKLTLVPGVIRDGYVISGDLQCPNCARKHPIIDGVPCLSSPVSSPQDRIDQYLDSQYGDINASFWARIDSVPPLGGIHLDAGCGTGRYTFFRGRQGLSVGLDANLDYLRQAARLQREGRVTYSRRRRALRQEDAEIPFETVSDVLFVLADIHDPPFSMGAFDSVSALNLIDTVKYPLIALGQIDALLRPGGQLLLTSPYVWTEDISSRDSWLETHDEEPHSYLMGLLRGEHMPDCGFSYRIVRQETGIPWQIRRQDTMTYAYEVDLIEAKKQFADHNRLEH